MDIIHNTHANDLQQIQVLPLLLFSNLLTEQPSIIITASTRHSRKHDISVYRESMNL
ncbi:MAG: hypothetical protein U0Y96_02150 [Candidatus Kapaibacterium sp.]